MHMHLSGKGFILENVSFEMLTGKKCSGLHPLLNASECMHVHLFALTCIVNAGIFGSVYGESGFCLHPDTDGGLREIKISFRGSW